MRPRKSDKKCELPVGPRRMVQIAASNYGVSVDEIKGPRRTKHLAEIRWRIAAAARAAGYNHTQIGRALNRDHTTVIHGLKRLEEMQAVR